MNSGVSTAINGFSCASATTCVAVGDFGVVARTTNGGASWAIAQINSGDFLSGVSCPSTSVCFAVGFAGSVWKTVNGGVNWSSQVSNAAGDLFAVSCPVITMCMAVGANGKGARTTDGTTWGGVTTATTNALFGVSCTNTMICNAAGDGGVVVVTQQAGSFGWFVDHVGSTVPLYAISCTAFCFVAGADGTVYENGSGSYGDFSGHGSTGEPGALFGVSCATTTVCWAVGDYGVISATTNGGTGWTANAGLGSAEYSISCASATTCVAVGFGGAIEGTTNGGSTWSGQTSGTSDSLVSISCPSTTICFAVGNNGTIRATTTGGSTWSAQTSNTTQNLTSISCPTTTTCFAVTTGSTFITTVDGSTWSSPAAVSANTGLTAISCPSPTVCFATDAYNPYTNLIYSTVTAGSTWTESFNLLNDHQAGINAPFSAISCPTTQACYAVGASGLIAATSDGGSSWRTNSSPTSASLTGVSCPSVSTCYASVYQYNGSTVLHTTDYGGSWEAQYGGGSGQFAYTSISCPGTTTCFAIGYGGEWTTTTVAGAAWTVQRPSGTTNGVRGLSCTDANNCYAAAGGDLLATHNGGTTWMGDVLGTTDYMDAITCPAANTCFAVGWPGAIYFTANGGATWSYQTNPYAGTDLTLTAVSCSSATTCIAIGEVGIALTTADGSTWNTETSGSGFRMAGISCPSSSLCVAVDTNGGSYEVIGGFWYWHATGAQSLSSISCPTPTTCYAVGRNGVVEKSVNGGTNWTATSAGTTQDLNAIDCLDATRCLVAGNSGVVSLMLDGSHWSGPLVTPTFNGLSAVAFPDLGDGWAAGNGGTILANSGLTPGCGASSLAPTLPSPQPAGTTVQLTTSTTHCSSPQYEFWIQYPNGTWYLGRGWGNVSSFSWNTTGLVPGTYTVHVWANQVGDSTATYEALAAITYVLTGCTGASINPPSVVQAAGSTVNLTAGAVGCPNPKFEFFALYPNGLWYQLTSWGSSSLNWSTTGLARGVYTIHVWANQSGASTATYEALGAATVSLSFCSGAGLGPPSDSAPAGSMVVLTATSSGCASPQYAFYVQFPNGTWYLKQPFSSSATFNWDTTGLAPGSYLVHAWVSAIGSGHDTFGSDTATLTGCTTATVSLTSPAATGTSVRMTGSGSAGCPNPVFEYWVQYPDNTWNLGRAWGPADWTWPTSYLRPGIYTIHAWANQSMASLATHEAIGAAQVTLTGCTAATVTPSSGSTAVGSSVLFTVAPVTCSGTPTYEFWVQYPDSSWHQETLFTTTDTWTWNTTGLAKGSYVIHVWVNNQLADFTKPETIGEATRTLN